MATLYEAHPKIVIPEKRLGPDALTFRVVVDYCKVNSCTGERLFPMLDIESVIADLGKASPRLVGLQILIAILVILNSGWTSPPANSDLS
jgi:hypothetical protein